MGDLGRSSLSEVLCRRQWFQGIGLMLSGLFIRPKAAPIPTAFHGRVGQMFNPDALTARGPLVATARGPLVAREYLVESFTRELSRQLRLPRAAVGQLTHLHKPFGGQCGFDMTVPTEYFYAKPIHFDQWIKDGAKATANIIHKEAQGRCVQFLESPVSVEMMVGFTYRRIATRFVRMWDAFKDEWPTRFDVYYRFL
jgi:hypothetical protein